MNYVIYNDAGEILRTGKCKPSDFEHQARQGEYVLEGTADTLLDRVVNGVVKKKTKTAINNISNQKALLELRYKRDKALARTDWTQMPDSPLSEQEKERYQRYRQELRDLPSKYDTINNIEELTFPNIEDF